MGLYHLNFLWFLQNIQRKKLNFNFMPILVLSFNSQWKFWYSSMQCCHNSFTHRMTYYCFCNKLLIFCATQKHSRIYYAKFDRFLGRNEPLLWIALQLSEYDLLHKNEFLRNLMKSAPKINIVSFNTILKINKCKLDFSTKITNKQRMKLFWSV